jgi:5'-3' exonuclease
MSTKYNSKLTIISADKDFLQLVNDNITVYSPIIKESYTPKTVKDKFGLPPYNFILYKTLMGDNSDKIEGVPGLGPKKLFKLFPELTDDKVTLEDIFEISANKYKENVIYSKIILNEDKLRNNYKIMNLGSPLMDENEKLYVETVVEQPVEKLKVAEFLKMYNEDGLGNILKNAEYWIRNTFTTLSSFK